MFKGVTALVKTVSRSILLLIGLAFALLGTKAVAQSEPQVLSAPPAEKYAVAPGGVDMRSGTYTLQTTDLSAGGGDSGLSLTRILGNLVLGHNNPFGNFSSNWDIMLTQKSIDIAQGKSTDGSGPDYQVSIRFGGRSHTLRAAIFGGTSPTFSPPLFSGYAKLTYTGSPGAGTAIYTYTAGDGTTVLFHAVGNQDCSTLMRCAYASSVTFPDGTNYVLNYDNPTPGTPNTIRLKSVVGTRGYALLFEYGGGGWNNITKACIINLAQAVLPASGLCPATAPATASYDYVSANGTRLAKVTDAAGKDWGFAYANVSSGMTMAFTKPGITTPWLTNTFSPLLDIDRVPVDIVSAQNFADGRSYVYGFDMSPQQKADEPPTIAGGFYTDNLGRKTTIAYDFPIMPGTGRERPCAGFACPPTELPTDGSDPNEYQQTPDPATITDPLHRVMTNNFCDPTAEAGYPASYHEYRCLVTTLQWTKDFEGGKTVFTTDNTTKNILKIRKIAKLGSGLQDIISSAAYDCTQPVCLTKPTSITDPKGNISTFTYDPIHGGVLTATMPAAQVNGTGSAIAAVTRYAYTQRYARISDGSGGYVQALTPVWLLISEKTCRTTATTVSGACAGGATDEVTTAYDYGPDSGPNLLFLRSTTVTADVSGTMTTLRTCFSYDALGRKTSETKPRGGCQ